MALLAEAILKLVADSRLRQAFGKQGRKIVLAEFDEKIVIEKTVEVYDEMITAI